MKRIKPPKPKPSAPVEEAPKLVEIPPEKVPPPTDAGHPLTPEERAAAVTLWDAYLNACVELAEVAEQILLLESRRPGLVEAKRRANATMRAQVVAFARVRGIDINDPAKGRWNFDTRTMSLHKVG